MNEIEKLNMIAEWQEQHKQLIQDLDNSKKHIAELEEENAEAKELLKRWVELSKPKLEGYPITPIQEQTEQFLSEVEK